MRALILKALLSFGSLIVLTQTEAPAENYNDSQYSYANCQDIYRAFNISSDYWLWEVNFPTGHIKDRRCTLFRVSVLVEDGMNYSSNYLVNDTWHEMKYVGNFYNYARNGGTEYHDDAIYNSLLASVTSEKWHPRNYTLVYADYMNCLILRVLDLYNGSACMLLVSDPPSCSYVQQHCQLMHHDACNKTNIYEKIYEPNCTKPEK